MKIIGGSLIIAGIALTPVSLGTSNGLTMIGLSLTSASTVLNMSLSVRSKIIITSCKPAQTADMFSSRRFSTPILSKIRQFAEPKVLKTLDKLSDAGFVPQFLNEASKFAKCEPEKNHFHIIEEILNMWSRKLTDFEEKLVGIYVKKVEFEIEEVIPDNSWTTRIKNKGKRCLDSVKLAGYRVLNTFPGVLLTGASKTYSACNACSNLHECFSTDPACSLTTNPNHVSDSSNFFSMQTAMKQLVPSCLTKSTNGITTLRPVVGCTLTGAGMFVDGVSIGLNVRKILKKEKSDDVKSLHEVITSYESDRKEFHKSMYQIAEKIEKLLIPSIQTNKNATCQEHKINEFNRLRKVLTAEFKSVIDIFNQDGS